MNEPLGPNAYSPVNENEIIHDHGVFRLKFEYNKAKVYTDVKASTNMSEIKSIVCKAFGFADDDKYYEFKRGGNSNWKLLITPKINSEDIIWQVRNSR